MTDLSPTQRALESADIARFVAASFGSSRRMRGCGPMSGGGFATVWWVELDDGRISVLKVAPPPAVPLLRYERDLLAAEARYFRLVASAAPEVPVPLVLHHGEDPNGGDWLFTGLLPGRSLHEIAQTEVDVEDSRVRAAFGAAVAKLHRVSGGRFGYDEGRANAPTWRGAFRAMIDDLLADAVDWDVELPVSAVYLQQLIDRHGDVLDQVRRPALVHFDGWDGNVLAEPNADGNLRLSGLVDGERFLFGDPLMDFVSPLLYRRVEEEPDHPFVCGYNAVADAPVAFDAEVCRRLSLYRLHLYLLMTIEMPSRQITRKARPDRYEQLAVLLDQELTLLTRTS